MFDRVLNVKGFWTCESCNMLGLHRDLNMPEYVWIVPEYAWLCLNMPKYAGICANMPKSAWIASDLNFPIVISCLLERVITYFNVYTNWKLWSEITRDCFLTRQNLFSL